MIVTRQWIHAHKSKKSKKQINGGGWTHAQISILGISWPPRKGWLSKACGKTITEAQRIAFESCSLTGVTSPRGKGGNQSVQPSTRRVERAIAKSVSDDFLQGYAWRKLRMVVLTTRGARCECCGATPADGVRMHVDHVKPRKTHPELSLVESNLQVLCEVCNHGKGNWDDTDWREKNKETVQLRDVLEDDDKWPM